MKQLTQEDLETKLDIVLVYQGWTVGPGSEEWDRLVNQAVKQHILHILGYHPIPAYGLVSYYQEGIARDVEQNIL